MSVDGIDFQIFEHGIKFYSHKNRKSALRYEICFNIIIGGIVWVNILYPAGAYSDITIFRDSLINFLNPGERVGDDDGYIREVPHHIKCPMSVTNLRVRKVIHGRLGKGQETLNRRFKDWRLLKQGFRHHASNHADILHAIVVLTQTSIDSGERIFSCEYRDDSLLNRFVVFVPCEGGPSFDEPL